MVKGTLAGYTDYDFFVDNGKYVECISKSKALRLYANGDSIDGLEYNSVGDCWNYSINGNAYYKKHKAKFDLLLPGVVVRNNVIVEFNLNGIPSGTTLKLADFCCAVEPRASLVKSTQHKNPIEIILTDDVYISHIDIYLEDFVFDISKLSDAGVDRLLQDVVLYPREIMRSFIGSTRLNYWVELSYLKYSSNIKEDRIVCCKDYYNLDSGYKDMLNTAVQGLSINYKYSEDLVAYYKSGKNLFTADVVDMLNGGIGSTSLIQRYMRCCKKHSSLFKKLFVNKVVDLVQDLS